MAGRFGSIGLIALLACLALGAIGRAAAPTTIAITDFGFVDTSDEAGDQRAAHATRLTDLTQGLKADLGEGGHYRVLSLACGGAGSGVDCRAADPAALAEEARRAGARLLVLGDVHKTSTLLLSTKVQVLDVQTNRLVLDRFLSFRGDNDEAWRRMTRFIARELDGLALDGTPP
ncbi:DUF2380 domain-containing protein [Nitrospirillum sp. BR 11163]|uniref:DUF2380 domain-containing protein n=1 Tax=Nitrospirillum sp. BR 11163 TaxID=3104323 RepID=UPI002AFE5303|nr:DUF2380 domain-containing protein [Nitrospirillum sp. BR 11163]MEA1676087.1 DUF2380 domain-containing protein [Nitrospirillum sp. BR 11163]